MNQQELKSLLHYDPPSGVFRWRNEMRSGQIKPWSVAGCTRREKQCGLEYTVIAINRKTYPAHRLAFLYMEGRDVAGDWIPDHKDGVGTNNAWGNLRLSDHKLNNENKRMLRNNTSGYMGVSWNKTHEHWVGRIKHNSKQIYLGSFPTAEEASAAVEAKRAELFKHNEGRHITAHSIGEKK